MPDEVFGENAVAARKRQVRDSKMEPTMKSWRAFVRRFRDALTPAEYVSLVTPRYTVAEAALLDELYAAPSTLSEIAEKHPGVSRRTLESCARIFLATAIVEYAGLRHFFTTGRRCRVLRLSKRGRAMVRAHRRAYESALKEVS